MKRLLILALIIAPLLSGGLLNFGGTAGAATNNSNLIDDFTFDNTNTLTAGQIDTWLNNFPSSCISPNNGFTASDPSGYSPNANFVDGHYTYGSPVTAGQVIYDAAKGHQINPQVLLTKLQNEEQLVDGSAGCSTWRYVSAVGYACTDSGTNTHDYTYSAGTDPYSSGSASLYSLNDSSHLVTPIYYTNGSPVTSITGSCVNTNVMAGFSEQVVHAAWALSNWQHKSEGQTGWAAVSGSWNHCEDNNTCAASYNIPAGWACYSHLMTQGTLKRCPTDSNGIYYDGYATIDGQALHMDNGATAALYVYTPHIQSFDTIFNRYFGSQYANDSFTAHPTGTTVVINGRVYLITADGSGVQSKSWITNGDVFTSYGYPWFQVKTGTTGDGNLPTGADINTLAPGTIFRTDNSPVYVMNYVNGSLVKQQISYAAFNSLGYTWDQVMYVAPGNVPAATSPSILFANQHPAGTLVSGAGKVFLLDQSTKRWVLGPDAFTTNNFSWAAVKPATSLDLGLSDGANVDLRQGNMLTYGGNIYLVDYDATGIMKRPVGPWECFANRWHYALRDLYQVSAGSLPARNGSLSTC